MTPPLIDVVRARLQYPVSEELRSVLWESCDDSLMIRMLRALYLNEERSVMNSSTLAVYAQVEEDHE